MLKHIVFFKIEESKKSELVSKLQSLKEEISEILHLEVGENVQNSPASSDVALITEFKGLEELEIYRVHPKHQEVVAWIQDNTTERRVVDYFID